MGYSFVDFGKMAQSNALSIRTIFNGKELEKSINVPGFSFTTLRVRGRGTVNYETDTVRPPSSDFSFVMDRVVGEREIVVTALVKANTNEVYRRGMSKLNQLLLSKSQSAIRFTDDTNYTYYGLVDNVQDGEEESNTQRVEITFKCFDPFKYTSPKTLSYTSAQLLSLETDFPVRPLLKLKSVEGQVTITNTTTRKSLIFRDLPLGVLDVDLENGTVTKGLNKVNALEHLVLTSDWEDFTIHNGDQVVINPPTDVEIVYRGVAL